MSLIKRWIRRTKRRIEVVAEILRHPQTPWYARAVGFLVIAYAASPLDLIPDFIPVLGYIDDLVIVPLGLMLALKMIPTPVWEECRQRAQETANGDAPVSWLAAGVILAIWLTSLAIVVVVVLRVVRR